MIDKKIHELATNGFAKFSNVLSKEFCEKLNESLEKSYIHCREFQVKNEVDQITDGTLHHLLATDDDIYLEVLNKIFATEIARLFDSFFEGNFIINTYGAVKNLKSKPSYVANIHRDIRFFSNGFPLMLQQIILLDDFTLENGATYLLSGSHLNSEKPNSEMFYANAKRAIGKRGDVFIFDSNLWHAAGINQTDMERRALTINFTKPFMKQQLDYCRAIGSEKVFSMPDNLKQILGYFSRVPSNLNEWYQKPEHRFYKSDQ